MDFYSRTRTARKIIVVDLGFLGDSVHLIPALWEIKRHYPEASLHTLSATVGAEVLQLAPCADKAWIFPLGTPSPPWWKHWDIIRALRREKFDLAINFSGADRTIFITALTGARWRLAQEGGRQHFWGPWLVPDWIARQSRDLPVYEQRRQVLKACGLTLSATKWDLLVPAPARQRAETLVPAGAFHFSVNASTPVKQWPIRHWIALGKKLLAEDPNLGADSGVLHLAMALGLPTVAIFREYSGMREWLPCGPQHRHVLAPCPCASLRQAPCEAKGEAACLDNVAPEQVIDSVRAALAESRIFPLKTQTSAPKATA